ncbi:MAG TPA: NFACT RNA binding domain-containing protein [Chthonomonadales bacterium]|nr:NFACT RNA binding domain-containing protein [Chthonomonadales bacterium]
MSTRISYDSLTLCAVSCELRRVLVQGVVQHIAQPTPLDVVLTVRHRGANHLLVLSCDSTFARAHLTNVKRPNPPTPPAFCMLLRKHLEGARISAVFQHDFDRVLELQFTASSSASYRLIVELMGKHSNIILVNEAGRVLDAAKRITRRLSRYREVLPGLPYLSPPAPEGKANPFAATPEEIATFAAQAPRDSEARIASLMAHFTGFSPFLAAEMVARESRGSLMEVWEEIFGAAQRGEWAPVLIRNEHAEPVGAYPFPTVQQPAEMQHPRDTINIALDHHYSVALPRAARDAASRNLEAALERAIRAKEKLRESLLRSLQEANHAQEWREMGELLLANLHRVEPMAESITVADYYAAGAPPRVIPLDPSKTPQENAEAYFRRYQKAKAGAERHREQLDRVAEELLALRAAQARLPEAKSLDAVRALQEELARTGLMPPGQGVEPPREQRMREPDFRGKKIRVYHTPEGWDIYVGENSEANDYLTTRIASPNDLWLHVRANTSAHTVIRTGNRPERVPPSVIRRAALLTAQHSPAKHSSLVQVDYTLRKYVRRPRGAPSGTVLYQHQKTIYVSPKTEDPGV